MKPRLLKVISLFVLVFFAAGCTFIFQTGRRSDVDKISQLSAQLDELTRAKKLLEERLSQEIQDKQVSLKMMEKGLVITVVGDLLFDSGKAKVRQEAYSLLDKVATVLKENVPGFKVGIEGHTDNVPIRYSGWKSNWELSTARALSVLHFLDEDKGVSPDRLSAIGYGEFRPVSTNDTSEGRQLNRRVEIVVLPEAGKIKDLPKKSSRHNLKEPEENLK
jgi:flagellar motor protein MotB